MRIGLVFLLMLVTTLNSARPDNGYYEDASGGKDQFDMPYPKLPSSVYKSFVSSSTLKAQGANSYSVKNLFDGDLTTCWSEGVMGYGKNEWVEIEFGERVLIDSIALANGYLKDTGVFQKKLLCE